MTNVKNDVNDVNFSHIYPRIVEGVTQKQNSDSRKKIRVYVSLYFTSFPSFHRKMRYNPLYTLNNSNDVNANFHVILTSFWCNFTSFFWRG